MFSFLKKEILTKGYAQPLKGDAYISISFCVFAFRRLRAAARLAARAVRGGREYGVSAVGGAEVLAAKGVSSRSCSALSQCHSASKGFVSCRRGMLAAARLAAREEVTGVDGCVIPTRAGFTRARTLSAVCKADVVTSECRRRCARSCVSR
ncbi:protein of unknown function (plasmid) [Caballeronia sp. S22]